MKEPPASPQQPSSPRNLFFRRPRQKRNPLSRPYDDEVGVILTKLLNQSRTFSYNSSSKAQPDSEHTFVVPPFLSKHNGRILHCRINRWRQIPPSRLWASLKELLYATHAYLWQPQNQPSRRNVFLLTATVLFFLYCLGVALVHAVIAYGAQTICAVSSGFFVLLLDHDEAEKACPNAIKELATCFQRGVHSLDNFLQVHRFAGREWNKLDMEWDRASNAASTRTRLWDLPPPTIHTTGQRIDPEFSVRPEWGDATAHHHAAINFCYAMLREEQLSKASTSNRQQKKASQASSVILHEKVPLILSETPKRSKSSGLINERDWGSDSIAKNKRASRSVVTVMSTNLRQPFPELASIKSLIEEFEVKVGDRTTPKSQIADYADEPLNSCRVLEEDTLSELRSDVQSVGSDVAGDLPWIDVGAKIGMSLLNSAHLQRALVSREAKDCFMERLGREGGNASFSDMASSIAGAVSDTGSAGLDTNDIVKQPPKPTHSMWSSPAIVVANTGEESPHCSASSLCDVDPMYNFDDSAKEDLSSPTLSPTPSIPIDLLLQKPRSSIYPRPFFGRTSNATRSCAKHFSTGERSPSKESKGTKQFSPNLTNMHVKQMKGWFSGQEVPLPAGSDNYVRELDAPSCVGTVVVSSEDASNTTDRNRRRLPLQRGIKVAVPVFPNQPRAKGSEKRLSQANYQMGTVMCSERIFVGSLRASLERFTGETNCLSVTVQLDRSFLRNGEFAELTLRVLDSWTSRYMPRHSKVPLGSCVVSSFGIGVLAGWRAEDDCHVVRSLWQRRGSGAAHAYLNRSAIYGTIEAGIGFRVETRFGWGTTQAYVKVGRDFLSGSYLVKIGEEGRMKGHIIEIARPGILSCHGAQFIPVIEHLREAANFQIQVDNYNAAFRERCLDNTRQESDKSFWRSWSKCGELFWNSFLKAAEEDRGFDRGVNEFMSDLISFLDRLDINQTDPNLALDHCISNDFEVECVVRDENEPLVEEKKDTQEPGFWIINDILGGVFKRPDQESDRIVEDNESFELDAASANAQYYERAFGVIQTLMKTVSIARAASTEHPHFRLALAIGYDFLLFVRTLVKVQRKNMSGQSLMIWKRALNEIASTFGPITQRIERIGRGIAARMEKQGRKAKVRTLKFVDIILGDERLLFALEQGEWTQCATRLEIAFVKSQIIPEECVLHYRKMVRFLVNHIQTAMANNGGAAERNNEKIVLLAQIVQWIAAPRRSVLKFFRDDNVLELFERILVRVFRKEELASRMLMIHASNFQSLRHFRMLKDFSTSGRLWIPLLDAADEEFSWMAAHVPESAKGFMCSLSNLFSLCVAQFHRINAGDLSMDWLDFLLEDDAVRIVHDIDIKLILALEAFSRDVKEMMAIVPYYASIDDDILNLMDEVDVDEFLKEGVEAMEDPEKLSQFIREKSTIAIERFLNYLPKMSIPVEKRELGEGWMLTCHGKDGGDLTLSDVKIRRKNLICQVIGGDSLFFPMFGDDDVDDASVSVPDDINPLFSPSGCIEESILDHIRGILLEAQRQGCWQAGFGGVEKPPTDRYVAAVLHNLPISSVLNCAIELWRNLEIDDDELLEIAVRDVSYQIELHQERKDETNKERSKKSCADISRHEECLRCPNPLKTPSFDTVRRRFNPRLDPTVLYLEMNKLSLKLDKFLFRIEKKARNIFDPLFEGQGTLCIQNISIKLRVECGKERTRSHGLGIDEMSPILLLKDLEVSLDRVQLKVQDTGFGSDWILNKAVHVFEANITRVVADNLRDQIEEQAKNAIENLNSYFLVNPNMLLNILDVTMDDLDERVVFV